jgi:hypothetical protein
MPPVALFGEVMVWWKRSFAGEVAEGVSRTATEVSSLKMLAEVERRNVQKPGLW